MLVSIQKLLGVFDELTYVEKLLLEAMHSILAVDTCDRIATSLLMELISNGSCRKLRSQNDDYFRECCYVYVFNEIFESEQAWNYSIVMPLGLHILHVRGQPVLDSLVQAYLFKLSGNPLTHAGFSSNTLGTFLLLGSARTHINTLSPPEQSDTLLAGKKKIFSF